MLGSRWPDRTGGGGSLGDRPAAGRIPRAAYSCAELSPRSPARGLPGTRRDTGAMTGGALRGPPARHRAREKYAALLFTFERACVSVWRTPQAFRPEHPRPRRPHRHGSDRRERAEARLQGHAQALHLHRRARTAARVDHATSPSRSSRRTPRSGRRRPSPTRSSGAWASWASSGWTSPSSTAARAAITSARWCSRRRSRTPTAAAWRWGSPCRPTWRCRRSSSSAPRSRSRSGWCRRSRARRSSASASPSPTPARTSRGSRPGRCGTARSS